MFSLIHLIEFWNFISVFEALEGFGLDWFDVLPCPAIKSEFKAANIIVNSQKGEVSPDESFSCEINSVLTLKIIVIPASGKKFWSLWKPPIIFVEM